jgi:gliding motility-associated-like protein
MIRILFFILSLNVLLPSLLKAHNSKVNEKRENTSLCFVENKGQWPSSVLYQAKMYNTIIWVEHDAIKFQMRNPSFGSHDFKPMANQEREHVFELKFKNGNSFKDIQASGEKSFYFNYFLGKDNSQWRNKVKAYSTLILKNIYNGIDVQLTCNEQGFQYNFWVNDITSLSQIATVCDGVERTFNQNSGGTKFKTIFGQVEETAPMILKDGRLVEQAISYSKQDDGSFSFHLNKSIAAPFVIDPTIVFATFSGSSNDNWGYCATYDNQGLFINTGITFGIGYPLTNGAFYYQGNPNVDTYSNAELSISKYNASGSGLVYSTIIGGTESECPAATVCNSAGDLYITGPTSSIDFPTRNYIQQDFGGGGVVTNMNITFNNGSDLFVLKLSSDGTNLMSSTYYGGAANEGIGSSVATCKGDIDVNEATGNVFVTSYTASTNIQTTLPFGGGPAIYRAMALKFNSPLNQCLWSGILDSCSTYNFGTSLSIKNDNEFYVVGRVAGGPVTSAQNLISQTSVTTYSHGIFWYVNINDPSKNKLKYLANELDVTTQLCDYHDGYLYACGTNAGALAQKYSPSNYSMNRNYTIKVDSTLSHVSMLTLKAGNSLNNAIAFKVDDCGRIYYSAFTPVVSPSSYYGAELTPDAYQQTSLSGEDIYMAVYGPSGNCLFGSFYGEQNINDHADGGHSCYDDQGKLYLAVCGSCGGSNGGFVTTSGAYSTTNNSSNCNAVSFLANIGKPKITADFAYASACGSLEYTFTSGFDDPAITWLVDNVIQSNGISFDYTFQDTLSHQVTMILPAGTCYLGDTIQKTIFPRIQGNTLNCTVTQSNCNQTVMVKVTGAAGEIAYINFGDGFVEEITSNQNRVYTYPNSNAMPDSIYIYQTASECSKRYAFALLQVLNKDIDTTLYVCDKYKPVTLDGLPGMTNYSWDNGFYLDKTYGRIVELKTHMFPGGTITCNEQYNVGGQFNCNRKVRYNIVFGSTAALNMNINASRDQINLGDVVDLTATPYAGLIYEWKPEGIMLSNGKNQVSAKPTKDTTIQLYIRDYLSSSCDLVLSVYINVEEYLCDDSSIDIANCVTPNADGINDYIMPHASITKNFHLQIYNRWGNVIYESADPDQKWFATCNGKDCDDGVYGYIATSTCLNGETIIKKGNITVIR